MCFPKVFCEIRLDCGVGFEEERGKRTVMVRSTLIPTKFPRIWEPATRGVFGESWVMERMTGSPILDQFGKSRNYVFQKWLVQKFRSIFSSSLKLDWRGFGCLT